MLKVSNYSLGDMVTSAWNKAKYYIQHLFLFHQL